MLAADKRMVVNMEHAVPATTVSPSSLSTLSGFIVYSAVVTSQCTPGNSASTIAIALLLFPLAILLTIPQLHALKTLQPYSFFIVEAKLFNPSDHVPQAVSEMYASGKFLQYVNPVNFYISYFPVTT